MDKIFITSIDINKTRVIRDFTLDLSREKSLHIILTGKNGSGKTTLLQEIKVFIDAMLRHNGNIQVLDSWRGQKNQFEDNLLKQEEILLNLTDDTQKERLEAQIRDIRRALNAQITNIESFGGVELHFSDTNAFSRMLEKGIFIAAYFDAKRMSKLETPKGMVNIPKNS